MRNDHSKLKSLLEIVLLKKIVAQGGVIKFKVLFGSTLILVLAAVNICIMLLVNLIIRISS